MNNKIKKPVIWLVLRAFPPISAIGSDRAVKWTKSFLDSGYDVAVFTIKAANSDKVISSSEFSSIKINRLDMYFADEFNGKENNNWKGKMSKAVFILLNWLFSDSGWTWAFQLKRSLNKEYYENSPSIILASGSPFLSFWVIRNFAKKYSIPYILDYRDLWTKNPHLKNIPFITNSFIRFIEKSANKDALFLTTISQGCVDVLSTDNKTRIMFNFPDRAYVDKIRNISDGIYTLDPQKLNLFFGGTLYPNERDLEPLALAISLMPNNFRDKIFMHYCGSSGEVANANFEKFNLGSNFHNYGTLSKRDALALMKSTDICISVVFNFSQVSSASTLGIMTTKIFDYLIANKTILNIAPENSELSKWLSNNNFKNVKSLTGDETILIIEYLLAQMENKFSDFTPKDGFSSSSPVPLWENQFHSEISPYIINVR